MSARNTFIRTNLPAISAALHGLTPKNGKLAKQGSVITYFRKSHNLHLDRREAAIIAEGYRGKPDRNFHAAKVGHHKDTKVTTSTGVIQQNHVVGGSVKYG